VNVLRQLLLLLLLLRGGRLLWLHCHWLLIQAHEIYSVLRSCLSTIYSCRLLLLLLLPQLSTFALRLAVTSVPLCCPNFLSASFSCCCLLLLQLLLPQLISFALCTTFMSAPLCCCSCLAPLLLLRLVLRIYLQLLPHLCIGPRGHVAEHRVHPAAKHVNRARPTHVVNAKVCQS
jgi:hypothetical protein